MILVFKCHPILFPPPPPLTKVRTGMSYHPMYWNWSLTYKYKLIIKSNSQNLNCYVENLYVQELKDHLPPECEDNLSKGDWDLHQSQESVSIIAKNLDCGYAHEVWNCSNACWETKIWVIKMANHDKRKYRLKIMQTYDKNEETDWSGGKHVTKLLLMFVLHLSGWEGHTIFRPSTK